MSTLTDMSNPAIALMEIPRLSRHGEALTSAERWQAITKRDATVNNFVYAVLTTKIYCRPSCPARLARRANVQFYDTPSQAEKAGFRPCKRCKPQSALPAAQSTPQAEMVEKACETMQRKLAAGLKPRLGDLAAQAGLTTSHFHRVFKKRMGVTPGQYATGIVQRSVHRSPGSVTSDDALSELEAQCFDFGDGNGMDVLDLDVGQSLALPEAGLLAAACESPVIVENVWNEFDVLLAAEQREISSLEPFFIDPRIISAVE